MALRMSQMLRFSRDVTQSEPAPAVGARLPSANGFSALAETVSVAPPLPLADFDPLIEAAAASHFDPIGEDAADPTDPAVKVYELLLSAVEQIFEAAATEGTPDGPPTVAAVRAVLDELGRCDALLAVTVRLRSQADSLAKRSANVAILAMRLGLEVNYDERRCLALGLCSLMHDIGMLTIPEDAMNARQFGQAQKELLHRHPIESQKMVQSFGTAFHWVGKIVVQVHERWDGGGYPQGLKEDEIHEFARIIGLVDTYEAMVQPRADRQARVVYNALREIIDLRNSQFERRLIKALIGIVSIFPLGSLVKINNGEIGRVVGTNRQHPTRPAVDILVDPRGRCLSEARPLNLVDEPMLYIVDPAIDESVLEGGG